jgi:(S)-2-hydroxyglutarate dehydrogenase
MRTHLLNIKNNTLEMGFIIEEDHQSIHILNAVSPIFNFTFPFAAHVCNKIAKLTN